MKKSTVSNFLANFYLVFAVLFLLRFMSSPELDVRAGFSTALCLGMFFLNHHNYKHYELIERAEAANKQYEDGQGPSQ